jgi:hypothetical protein
MVTQARIALGILLLAGLLAGCATPLGSAIKDGDVRKVKALLDQGADINERDACWGTPASGRLPSLGCAAWNGNVEVAKLLLERGANINASMGDVFPTALNAAAFAGHTKMVQFLLERGALCCEENKYGRTALTYAQEQGDATMIRLLEQAEARQIGTAPSLAQPTQPPLTSPLSVTGLMSDVDTPPAMRAKQRPNAYAVVIGIEQYRERLPKADFADRDARLVGDYLTKVMGYPEQNVVVRLNERASRTDLVKYFEEWLRNNVEAGGSVFVYYSGHGAPNPKTGDAYLVPYDGDPAFVESTAYPLKQLYAALNKLPAKDVTVVLDSCFSGAGGRSVIAEGARPMMLSVENPVLAGNKAVVLAASSGTQISSTFKEQGHGLLTYYFLKGLQGDGDLNRDGAVEMKELFDYLKPQVQRVARKQYNNEQTPQLLGSPEMLTKGVRLIERAQ